MPGILPLPPSFSFQQKKIIIFSFLFGWIWKTNFLYIYRRAVITTPVWEKFKKKKLKKIYIICRIRHHPGAKFGYWIFRQATQLTTLSSPKKTNFSQLKCIRIVANSDLTSKTSPSHIHHDRALYFNESMQRRALCDIYMWTSRLQHQLHVIIDLV